MSSHEGLRKFALAAFAGGMAFSGNSIIDAPGNSFLDTHLASAPELTEPMLEPIIDNEANLLCDVDVYAKKYDELKCEFIRPGNPLVLFNIGNLTSPSEEKGVFLLAGSAVRAKATIPFVNKDINVNMDIQRIGYEVHYPSGWIKHVEIPVEDKHIGYFKGELFVTYGLPEYIKVKNSDGAEIGRQAIREPIEVFLANNPPPAANDETPPLTNN